MVKNDEAEKLRMIRKSQGPFEAADQYFDVRPEKVQVPYEDVLLDRYFFSPHWIKGP